MSLVKFETNKTLDMEIESIKLSRPDCNTNSAATKYALKHYLSVCEENNELKKQLEDLRREYIEIHSQVYFYFSSEEYLRNFSKTGF